MIMSELILKMFLIQLIRYLLFAGAAYLVICQWGAEFFSKFRIQKAEMSRQQISHELKYSVSTSFIFGIIFAFILHPDLRPYTQIYTDSADHPTWWIYGSIVALTIINDTYFYWMHRALHDRRIFKYTHHTHHLSLNPSPLASYSFHPIEAALEAIWIVPVIFFMPVHFYVLIAYSLISLINNIRGHLSVDLLPERIKNFVPLRWINSSKHHSLHHKYFTSNYGLYFMFWDRLCKTERKDDSIS